MIPNEIMITSNHIRIITQNRSWSQVVMRCHEWAWGWDTLGINHVLHVPSYQSDPNQNATLYLTQKRVVGRWCPNCWPAKPLTFFYARCGEQFHHHTFVGLLADAFCGGMFFWGWRRWPENETPKWIYKWRLKLKVMNWFFEFGLTIVETEVPMLWWRNWSCSLEDKEVSSKHPPFREAAREGRWKGVKMEHGKLSWP